MHTHIHTCTHACMHTYTYIQTYLHQLCQRSAHACNACSLASPPFERCPPLRQHRVRPCAQPEYSQSNQKDYAQSLHGARVLVPCIALAFALAPAQDKERRYAAAACPRNPQIQHTHTEAEHPRDGACRAGLLCRASPLWCCPGWTRRRRRLLRWRHRRCRSRGARRGVQAREECSVRPRQQDDGNRADEKGQRGGEGVGRGDEHELGGIGHMQVCLAVSDV